MWQFSLLASFVATQKTNAFARAGVRAYDFIDKSNCYIIIFNIWHSTILRLRKRILSMLGKRSIADRFFATFSTAKSTKCTQKSRGIHP